MRLYSQQRAPLRRLLEALVVNHPFPLHANPLRAPLALLISWIAAAAITALTSCLMTSIWAVLFFELDAALVMHLVCCTLLYVAWSWRAQRRSRLTSDELASLTHACLTKLAPYVDQGAEAAFSSGDDLFAVTLPLRCERVASLTLSSEQGRERWSLEIAFGSKASLDARSAPDASSHQLAAEGDELAALVVSFADFVSQCAQKAGLRAVNTARSARPAILHRHHKGGAPDPDETPRRAALSDWEVERELQAPPWRRHPWVHVGVYWLLAAWPLGYFMRFLAEVPWQNLRAVEECVVLACLAGVCLLAGLIAMRPPLHIRGLRADLNEVHSLMWDGDALTDSMTGERVVIARPFSLEVTREPAAEGGVVILNWTLTQRTDHGGARLGGFQRLRFSVPVVDGPKVAAVPPMTLRAPRVCADDFEVWLEPLLAFGER